MIELHNMWQTLQRPCSCTFRGSTYFDGRFVELCMLDRAETSYGIETWKRSHLLVESTWNELPMDWICQYEHSKVPSGINYLQKRKFGLQKPCPAQAFTVSFRTGEETFLFWLWSSGNGESMEKNKWRQSWGRWPKHIEPTMGYRVMPHSRNEPRKQRTSTYLEQQRASEKQNALLQYRQRISCYAWKIYTICSAL